MPRKLDARDFDTAAWWPIAALARAVAEYEDTWQATEIDGEAEQDA